VVNIRFYILKNIRFYIPCEGSVFSVTNVLQQDLLLQIPHSSLVEKTGTQASIQIFRCCICLFY